MTTRFGWAIASALLVASMGSASAADMSMPMKTAPPAAPAQSWTGCYVDGGIGYSVWNNDHYLTGHGGVGIITTATTRDGGNGWLGRVGGGCDWQLTGELSKWVIGGFADYDFVSAGGSNSPSEIFPAAGPGVSPISANVKQNGTYYVGGRIGYIALPGLLTYVNAGWTGTHFSQGNEFQTATGNPINFAYPGWSSNGWFVGGGTEYMLPWFNGLFLRSEYRYASYSGKDIAEFSTISGVPDGNVLNIKTIDQTVTTGLVWKFNWGGPVVAKY